MNQFSPNQENPQYKNAIEMLESLGAKQGAQGRVPISRVHLVSTFASKMGEGGIQIVERMVKEGILFQVLSTTDPCDIEPQYCSQLKFSQKGIFQQKRLSKGLLQLGAIPIWSCTPYLEGGAPHFGEHIAWGESSAVIFANSILGARTNQTSVFEDLFAGITGWVPKYGMHLEKNRRGKVEVQLKIGGKGLTEFEYGLIGYLIGTRAKNDIPVVMGLPKDLSNPDLISMLSCAAITSSLPLIHLVGITPEAKSKEEAFHNRHPEWKLTFSEEDLKMAEKELSTAPEGKIDGIILGCPHYPMEKLRKVAQIFRGRKIKKGIIFWIMTTPWVKSLAKEMGLENELRKVGVKVLSSTCCFHFPPESFGSSEVFISDSPKGSYLIPSMIQKKAIFASTEECVEAAIKGEFKRKK